MSRTCHNTLPPTKLWPRRPTPGQQYMIPIWLPWLELYSCTRTQLYKNTAVQKHRCTRTQLIRDDCPPPPALSPFFGRARAAVLSPHNKGSPQRTVIMHHMKTVLGIALKLVRSKYAGNKCICLSVAANICHLTATTSIEAQRTIQKKKMLNPNKRTNKQTKVYYCTLRVAINLNSYKHPHQTRTRMCLTASQTVPGPLPKQVLGVEMGGSRLAVAGATTFGRPTIKSSHYPG